MTVTLADVIAALETAYPPRLAEPWDTGIGLTCGDPGQRLTRVLLAVDVDPITVSEARETGADLLLTHHPMLFRPVQSVAADTDKGALIHPLIRSGIAHFAAHTNADRAVGGVNDALAEALGLVDTAPLVPAQPDGMAGEGLGRVGVLGSRPRGSGMTPPAADTDSASATPGMTPSAGRALSEFTEHVAACLPATAWGVRAAGDPDREIRTVAVCGGAGAGELGAATAAGADVYVTSDLSHHTVAEHVADPARPAVVEVAHWAGEWPWLARAAGVMTDTFGDEVTAIVSTRRTDAWSVHAHAPGQ